MTPRCLIYAKRPKLENHFVRWFKTLPEILRYFFIAIGQTLSGSTPAQIPAGAINALGSSLDV
jgi:hypothetical protein